jgi:aspartokinase
MAKIKLHNILHVSDQALLTIQLDERKAQFLPSILYALREEGISIRFITQSMDRNGNFTLSLATAQQDLDWVRAAFQEGLDLARSTPPKVRRDVVLITLYGPHFGEIPGVASRILSTLAADGVEVLALSASLNSSLLVVLLESLAKSLRSLKRIFEIPEK